MVRRHATISSSAPNNARLPAPPALYDKLAMNQKSITFRCSASQHRRLNESLRGTGLTRTGLITTALLEFLAYADQKHIRNLDLFALVRDIDSQSDGPPFRDQA